jgi:pyrroloquinoline-quinone synthase
VAEGLGALAAYETQAAAVASSKAQGLTAHYDLDANATEFWSVHAEQDKEHGEWTTEALTTLSDDSEAAVTAARRAADAWWSFLEERESLARVTTH